MKTKNKEDITMGRIKVTYEYDSNKYSTGSYYNSFAEAVKNVHKHLKNADDTSWTYITGEGTIYGTFYDKIGACNWQIEEVSEEEFSEEMNQY